MAKQVSVSNDVQGASVETIAQTQSFEVLCAKGEFIHNQKHYHHDNITLEDAKRLIEEGYQYLRITTN